jgi:hypothetical protein
MTTEITNATGDIIDPAAFDGRRENMIAPSTWQRVLQQKPDKSSWSLWKKVLRQKSYKNQGKQYLIQPLGDWIIPQDCMRQEWSHWQDPQTQRLYHKDEGEIREYKRMWYDYDCDDYQIVNKIPQTAVPVDVSSSGFTWRVSPHHNNWRRASVPIRYFHVNDEIKNKKEWEKQLLQHIEFLVPMDTIAHPMRNRMILASDGSVQDRRASFGWILSTPEGLRMAKCNGPAYGYKPTSF